MATLASDLAKKYACPLCSKPYAPQPDSDRLSWVGYCERNNVPIVALKRHSGSPSAGEWRHIEMRAKRTFPEFRWQRSNDNTRHFYLHAVSPFGRCNVNHAMTA